METPTRSAAKAISYRIVASLATGLLSYLVLKHFDYSKSTEAASLIGTIDVFVKLATYYVHERAWEKIPFGRSSQRYSLREKESRLPEL